MKDEKMPLYRYLYLHKPWSLNYVVYRSFPDSKQTTEAERAGTHMVASFVLEVEAADYCEYRNRLMKQNGTDEIKAPATEKGRMKMTRTHAEQDYITIQAINIANLTAENAALKAELAEAINLISDVTASKDANYAVLWAKFDDQREELNALKAQEPVATFLGHKQVGDKVYTLCEIHNVVANGAKLYLGPQPAAVPDVYVIKSYGVFDVIYTDKDEAEFQCSCYPLSAKAVVIPMFAAPKDQP